MSLSRTLNPLIGPDALSSVHECAWMFHLAQQPKHVCIKVEMR